MLDHFYSGYCLDSFANPILALLASPESVGTTFWLFTNKNEKNASTNEYIGQQLHYENATSILMSNFNVSQDVKVIIHGFGSSRHRFWVKNMTHAFLNQSDFNVINVDWENGARMPNYVQAAGKLTKGIHFAF